jgi:N-dimethylarginine dimethylaminohydrolase
MSLVFGSQSMVAPLRTVIVKRPQEAFRSKEAIQKQWKILEYKSPPDLQRATQEHQRLVSLLSAAGVTVLYLPVDDRTGLDSLYTHDPVLITEAGAIVFQTGKPDRRGEGPAFSDALKNLGVPVLGIVDGAATAEAGDMVWLDSHTLVVGRSFRTNSLGVELLSHMLQPLGVRVLEVHLPHWNGPRGVLHLMSCISLVDEDLAVVYRRLLPVPLFELLNERAIEIVDIPDTEYETLGCNVLSIAPRNVVMVQGNPVALSRLEAAGCKVSEFEGNEICFPGNGGPTCLTRPLLRR